MVWGLEVFDTGVGFNLREIVMEEFSAVECKILIKMHVVRSLWLLCRDPFRGEINTVVTDGELREWYKRSRCRGWMVVYFIGVGDTGRRWWEWGKAMNSTLDLSCLRW